MKKFGSYLIPALAFLMMGLAALFLARAQAFQKLGEPGVRIVDQPMLDPQGKVVKSQSVFLPEKVLDYASQPIPLEKMVLESLPQDTTFGQRLYTAPDGFQIQLNVVLMGVDRSSIHKPQACLTGSGWRILASQQDTIPLRQPHDYDLPVTKLNLQRAFPTTTGENVLRQGYYIYWFVADNQLSADYMQRMVWMARDMVRYRVLQRWAYVSFFTYFNPGQDEAVYQRIRQFAAAAVPQFQKAAGPARQLARKD